MNLFSPISQCRISDSSNLVPILDLGSQNFTGIFPQKSDQCLVPSAPIELVYSPDSGLVQLNHNFDPKVMYGDNYGYRSGLNKSMVSHLSSKISLLEKRYPLPHGSVVLDIGSNDATTLKSYQTSGLSYIGIDPTGEKFADFYGNGMVLVPNFFNADFFFTASKEQASIITSIAMFYDLPDPISFCRDIKRCLAPNGVWHFEQSYLHSMLRTNSYDTICHEHLEYYDLTVIDYILNEAGLKVIDVEFNAVNGGSFALTASHKESSLPVNSVILDWVRHQEKTFSSDWERHFFQFKTNVLQHRSNLRELIFQLKSANKRIAGYGASTKGNVLLQFCELDSHLIDFVVDVNPYKFDRYTPGTNIPIVSDEDASQHMPDYYLLLPWHFRDNILPRESAFRANGGKFIIPFPFIEIV